jgi:hypothetical protein
MSDLNSLGLGSRRVLQRDGEKIEQVLTQRPLHRVLAFTGRTIDDVVNSSVARNQVRGFYRLYRQIERQSEITELERQWNGR